MTVTDVSVRSALPADVLAIRSIVESYASRRILLAHDLVAYYEAVHDFVVAEAIDGTIVGCGALHVMWKDLGEIRTLAVLPEWLHTGIGHAMLESLVERARELRLERLFCLTFEVGFFGRHGFNPIEGDVVDPDVFKEMLLSHDDGVAEFLDLASVKPNTLGNTRMLLEL
ncbi:MAG: amino-acid N-acetyltransferase [Demequinaceae bacterium]|nr:amino-acid N-acetyltransferase [Demequinaceae bacterium]